MWKLLGLTYMPFFFLMHWSGSAGRHLHSTGGTEELFSPSVHPSLAHRWAKEPTLGTTKGQRDLRQLPLPKSFCGYRFDKGILDRAWLPGSSRTPPCHPNSHHKILPLSILINTLLSFLGLIPYYISWASLQRTGSFANTWIIIALSLWASIFMSMFQNVFDCC